MEHLIADVLVVGGSTGGTAAAIQAARCGVNVMLVSEFTWLGGMLTAAGVSAPDGNELLALQTGLWGEFLRELRQRQSGGLDQGWVSFFTYHPAVGAAIFADWVKALPNLKWLSGQTPLEVVRTGDRLTAVRFQDYTIDAQVILDGTELGDLLDLGEVPHRWGWELQFEWGEPSAPIAPNSLTENYPVQTPTWVVMMRDWGEGAIAPEIPAPPLDCADAFEGAWDGYEPEQFLNYGRLSGDRFMINWPQQGNDYGDRLQRLVKSPAAQRQVLQEAQWFSQGFARHIQTRLGRRYGLAEDMFPLLSCEGSQPKTLHQGIGGGAFALQPYYRESRRLVGLETVREQDILPIDRAALASSPESKFAETKFAAQRRVAPLPLTDSGQSGAIALGNYANDHHYPAPFAQHLTLTPKSLRWGGRWTGTPFALPYGCLVPAEVDGLLVCEKNMSVSHIANGATRLQPVVMAVGQAAGAAAALCVQQGCQPREISVRSLQETLLTDAIAPAALVPLFNVPPQHPDWLTWQRHYLDHPDEYPADGYAPVPEQAQSSLGVSADSADSALVKFSGIFQRLDDQHYQMAIATPETWSGKTASLVTLDSRWDQVLLRFPSPCAIEVKGRWNSSGQWILAEHVVLASPEKSSILASE
ncbi:MAG: FAD-dependent oxidoreductase [Elainellaceae cyanobacterium]